MTSNLRKLSRLIFLLIGGGAALFVVCALLLAYTHPNAPANTLVNRHTVWLFLPSALMMAAGIYISLRHWRCRHCGWRLTTRFPIPRGCPRCGRDIGLAD
jgi:hypothetical protein